LTDIAVAAFTKQLAISGPGEYLFPSDENASGHQKTFKTAWHATLRRAKVTYFRIYDLRSTYATRLSAGSVADEWVTQLLRQGDAKVFKKYSQMKRGALESAGGLVGAGRFERPTPCAQGRRAISNGAIGFGELLLITTTWGICFRSISKLLGWNR